MGGSEADLDGNLGPRGTPADGCVAGGGRGILGLSGLTPALLALAFGAPLAADDPNPTRNRVAAAADLPVTWDVAAGDGVLWSAELGTTTYGGPTIAGDLVVVGTNNERPRDPAATGDRGILMAFDRRDGGFRWQIAHEKLAVGEVNDWPLQGVCSTPSFDGERLYYVSNRAELVAVDLAGETVWSLDMIAEWGVFPKHMAASTPLAAGGLVFASTSNGVTDDGRIPAPAAPSFVAVDRATGAPVWTDAGPGAGLIDGQWGSPALAAAGGAAGQSANRGQVVFPGGDGRLYAFDPATGESLWRFDGNAAAAGQGGEAGRSRSFTSPPAAAAGRKTRAPSDAAVPTARADRAESGHAFVATPVLHEDTVYIAMGRDPEVSIRPGVLWAIDAGSRGAAASSRVRWRFEDPDFGRAIATVAVAGGIVYAADLNGFLFALDADTGEKLWVYDALAPFWSSPLVADGKVYAADTEGDVTVLRHGRTLDVLAENVMPGPVYASPSTDGAALYVATSETLYALGL